ncbi:hypothetical protein PR003_g32858, partial [Phytophthora rubi]
ANYRARYESQQQDVTAPTLHQQEAEDIALGEVLYQMIDDNFGFEEPARFDGEPFGSELDRWLTHQDRTMTAKTSSSEVCAWMKNIDQFPRIRMMARDFLGVMATSVPSEQAFSAAGAIVSSRRARLGDDAVAAVSEMQSFMKFNETSAKLEKNMIDDEDEEDDHCAVCIASGINLTNVSPEMDLRDEIVSAYADDAVYAGIVAYLRAPSDETLGALSRNTRNQIDRYHLDGDLLCYNIDKFDAP